jgi:hypothetical protein
MCQRLLRRNSAVMAELLVYQSFCRCAPNRQRFTLVANITQHLLENGSARKSASLFV